MAARQLVDAIKPFLAEHLQVDLRVDALQRLGGAGGLVLAHGVGERKHLPVEVGDFEHVEICDGEVADARAR